MNINLDEFLNESKLWNEIRSLDELEFFKVVSPENLTVMQALQYGQRTVYEKFASMDDEKLANIILITFKDKWNNLINFATADIDLGGDSTKKVVEKVKNGETRTSSDDTINKVSAYNSEDMVNDGGTHGAGTQTLDGDKDRVLTESNLSLNSLISNLSLLQQTNIINVVLKDVSDYITLSIY